VSEEAPSNAIVGAGGGFFHAANVTLTRGVALSEDERTVEGVAAHWAEIIDRTGEIVPQSGRAIHGCDQSTAIAWQLRESPDLVELTI
jgi:hypothetical protein